MTTQTAAMLVRTLDLLESNDEAALDLMRALSRFDPGTHLGVAAVTRFLASADPLLRAGALGTLVFEWGVRDIGKQCASMLHEDPDDDVRSCAAFCLASIFEGSKDPHVAAALARVVQNVDEVPYVRVSAYKCLFSVTGVPPDAASRASDFSNALLGVDWDFVSLWADDSED